MERCVKINRFGHAMDPDRGILYYVNMLVGCSNTITEIQVNRRALKGKGGYNPLFDTLSKKEQLIDFVKNIYENHNNIMSESDAIWIFTRALNLDDIIKIGDGGTCFKKANGMYQLDNKALTDLLENHSSNATKSVFFLSSELRLTDVDRKIICKIVWDPAVANQYLDALKDTTNYTPTKIEPLKLKNCSEDIVTYASIELYKKLKYKLLAVSYPGAQGDRCILIGNGRDTKRKYIDIIAYKKSTNRTQMFLEECKSTFNKQLQDDTCRLQKIKKKEGELFKGILLLADKSVKIKNISDVYISVGAKGQSNNILYKVDYIFMFDVNSNTKNTIISYSVALINMKLSNEFLKLSEDGQNLNGKITLDKIYKVK